MLHKLNVRLAAKPTAIANEFMLLISTSQGLMISEARGGCQEKT